MEMVLYSYLDCFGSNYDDLYHSLAERNKKWPVFGCLTSPDHSARARVDPEGL
jgi:hypothetical protein